MSNTTTTQPTMITTNLVRFSYLKVFKAESIEGSDPKFSTAILIPKSDKAGVLKIQNAIKAAIEAGKTTKFAGKTGGLKLPLRDGDTEKPDDTTYAGMYFLNASAKTKPGIVDKDVQEILDPTAVKSGDWGKVNLTFYAFNTNGNKGIAAGLNHLQKIKDGEALGGPRVSADEAFEEENAEDYDFLD